MSRPHSRIGGKPPGVAELLKELRLMRRDLASRERKRHLPKLLKPQEACDVLKVRQQTLRKWRMDGEGPPWMRVGGQIRYRVEDLEDWLRKRTVTPRS